MAQRQGINSDKDIRAVTGISEVLVKQYKEMIKESKKEKTRRENLEQLIERNSYREGIKKRVKKHSAPLAAMMGGLS